MTKVFLIMLEFTSWDNCIAYADKHGISQADTYALCVPYEFKKELAPETSPRPRARPEQ